MSEEKLVNLTIDGIQVSVPESYTVLEAARKANIEIPTLCYLKEINEIGACRMCLVEIEGMRGLPTSCITKVAEGMVVHTHTEKVVKTRRTVLELLLSNHDKDCLTCRRNGNCELQKLCEKFNIHDIRFEGERSRTDTDDLSPSLVRDNGKCILCRRCTATCKNVQNICAIETINRGYESCIGTACDKSLNDVDCILCGQCIESCPTGALHEKDDSEKVWNAIHDPEKYVVVQTAPAVRVAIGEEFGMPIGTNAEGKMVTALKRLGFDKVFDTNTGADFTIVEEATEFVDRLTNGGVLPMITSCCPSWIRFAELNYPEDLGHLSSCKSPHQMFGSIIKTYFANRNGIDPSKIVTVSVMPCVAKKYEATREEMQQENGLRDVDYVISTRELARMIKQNDIDFINLEDSQFEDPMGEATGAAAIFGTTGGVMEAALRTAADLVEGRDIQEINYQAVRGEKGIKETTVTVNGREIRICVVSGIKNVRKVMDEVHAGNSNYDFIEVMTCPGGCIMGGGQPIKNSKTRATVDVRKLRSDALYEIDEKSTIRKSHHNPQVNRIYNEFFGQYGSSLAHKYLHTHYSPKQKYRF